jgi:hypothetical protein
MQGVGAWAGIDAALRNFNRRATGTIFRGAGFSPF